MSDTFNSQEILVIIIITTTESGKRYALSLGAHVSFSQRSSRVMGVVIVPTSSLCCENQG